MITCDICANEIKKRNEMVIVPPAYTVPGVRDACKQCDKKLDVAIEKIRRDSMKARRKEIQDTVQALKDSKGNLPL